MEDWYRISLNQIEELGSLTIVQSHGNLGDLLSKVYPEHPWDSNIFSSNGYQRRASQRILKIKIQELFPNAGILVFQTFLYSSSVVHECFVHPKLQFESGVFMQLDIFLPELSLAFEYNGKHHYTDIYHPVTSISPSQTDGKANTS